MSENKQACWEYFKCTKVLCPAHGNPDHDCWLILGTHCTGHRAESFLDKLPACLGCSYFEKRGDSSHRSWNEFLAEQMKRSNKRILEQIYQKEETFFEILKRIPDGLFTTDREMRITYFNPAAERITGFFARDAVGMYCKDVFKNEICETDCALKKAVAEKRDIHNREYTITNINGYKVPIMCSTSAFYDENGRLTGGIEIFKDITKQKKLQEEILKREKNYRRIFEGSHDMIYITNERGDVLDINQAGVDLLDYESKGDLLSSIRAEDFYLNPEDRKRFLAAINETGHVKDFEVDFKKRTGTPLHVLISSRRYENPETGDIEFAGVIKDITDRKQAEESIKRRNLELSLLNSVAIDFNRSWNLTHILLMTLKNVLQVLDLRRGAVFLIDREKKTVQVEVTYRLPRQDSGKPEKVMFKDDLLQKYLVREDVKLTHKPTFPSFRVTYRAEKTRAVPWLSCFLIASKGKGLGFFGLDIPSERILSRAEVHLMGSLGNFLGGAIENARLMETIRQHRCELKKITERLFQTQEEERRRIARELHDEAGQALTAIKLGLDHLEERGLQNPEAFKESIHEIRKGISHTASEIRQLSYRLHPTLLSDLGLEPALDAYFQQVARYAGLDIQWRVIGFDSRIDVDTETVLYRFAQETLNNALKHSGADHFFLSIIKSYPKVIFLAEDDGVGFDGQIKPSRKKGFGLLGMRERVSLLGGSFQLQSTTGEGTRIRIEIPLAETLAYGEARQNIAG